MNEWQRKRISIANRECLFECIRQQFNIFAVKTSNHFQLIQRVYWCRTFTGELIVLPACYKTSYETMADSLNSKVLTGAMNVSRDAEGSSWRVKSLLKSILLKTAVKKVSAQNEIIWTYSVRATFSWRFDMFAWNSSVFQHLNEKLPHVSMSTN